MTDQWLRDTFRDFCVSELAGENFDFWESVELYKKTEDEVERMAQFNEIYERFFSSDSEHEMNISGMEIFSFLSRFPFCLSLSR